MREEKEEGGAQEIDLDALEKELGRILDETVAEALAEQKKSFERDYARLWDSRSFWRRAAVGEGCAIAACILGGILVWNLDSSVRRGVSLRRTF